MIDYHFNFAVIWRQYDDFLVGLALGLTLAIASLAIGSVIGLLVAYARLSTSRILRAAAWIYVEIIRNTPLLLLVFFVYFGLPEFGFSALGKIESFILTLSLYAGAYMAEVFRSGLQAIPRAYVEAAMALGLSPWRRQVRVVLPVMFRITLPALSNNLISLFKDTSLAAAIAVPELTFIARQVNTNTFRVIESWLTASVLYLAAAYLIAMAMRRIEKRYAQIR